MKSVVLVAPMVLLRIHEITLIQIWWLLSAKSLILEANLNPLNVQPGKLPYGSTRTLPRVHP